MLRWLESLWRRSSNPGSGSLRAAGEAERYASNGAGNASEPDETDIRELLEVMRKLTRHSTKLALKLDELGSKQDAGFGDLRSKLDARPAIHGDAVPCDDVLDALDALDEAARALDDGRAEGVAQGLRAIGARLTRFLAQQSLVRLAEPTTPIDGRLFRVVGAEHVSELPDGAPVRVVRAAVRRGDRVVREGEVIVNRREST